MKKLFNGLQGLDIRFFVCVSVCLSVCMHVCLCLCICAVCDCTCMHVYIHATVCPIIIALIPSGSAAMPFSYFFAVDIRDFGWWN